MNVGRFMARWRFTWRLYERRPAAILERRRRRNTPPSYIGDGMAGDIFPDGDGWYWNRDHWVNKYTGQEGPVLL